MQRLPASPDTDSARVSLCFDFTSRTWIPLLDGLRVSAPLPMPPDFARPTQVIVTACVGGADDLVYSSVRPAGLSLDFDSLPDEWETRHFGSPDASGDADDADADGLDNLAEYRAGTDPLRPDTDADGMADGWEAAHGLDPLDPADALLDPDGDGRDNAAEYAGGSDPGVPDLPADLRAPGLRAFLYALPDTPSAIPDTASLAADAFAVLPAIDFPATAVPWLELENAVVAATALPDSSTFGLSDFWTLSAHGFLDIPASGVYTLRLTSDDGSRLWLDGAVAIDNDGAHSMSALTATLPLSPGLHPLRVDYFEASGDAGLVLEWRPPGAAGFVPVPATNLCHDASENLPPQIRLAPPARPYVAGETVPLLVGAWDFDGAVARVDFLVGTNAPVSVFPDATGLFALDAQLGETEPPSLPVTAIAYDEAGAASAPATMSLEVWPRPPGFAPGLAATYHPFAANPGALPDFAVLTNGVPAIESQLAYASSTNPWPAFCRSADGPSAVSGGVGGSPAEPGLFNSSTLQPADFGCFAAEIRGALLVTEPGRHELVLSSDDGSRLWLDGELVIDNDGDHSMRGLSASRVFAPGLHPLRVEYYNGWQDAGLVLSWTPPSATGSAPIPPQHLYHPVGPLDADGDGLPDWWEAAHGLDPSDPADALLDPDADGLTSLAEFLAGTDPHLADTDGDGMPDGWEAAHGLCPFVADALDDLDGDGLTNLDEFRAGSDPHLADTDGDGLSDYEEFHGLGTDPAVCEFNANWQTVATVPAASASARSAGWFRRGTHLAAFRRGHFDIDIATETPDTLFVRVDVAHIWHATATDLPAADLSSRFLVYLGDQLLGVSTLVHAPGTPSSFIRLPLPHLPAGSHRLRVLWDGIPGGLGVCVRTVSLETPGGPDNDSDGSPDWILARSRRDDTVPEVFETHVSPVCLEGTASHPALVSIGIPDSPDPPLFATPTSSSTWYADLPLSGHGTNLFLIAFENGLRTAPASIVWTPIDIAEPDSMSLSARKGDTLLLTASSPATLVASVNGSQRPSLALAAGDTVELPIDDWGAWTLAVARPGQPAVTHSVSVPHGEFPAEDPAILLGRPRTWLCPDVSDSAFLASSAPQLSLWRAEGGLGLSTSSLFVPQWIVARLAEDGPILDVARVRPFALRALPDGGLRSGGYAEECEIWVDELLTLGVPGDVTLRNTIVAGGIVLDDYSAVREIPGSSLPPAARLPLRFLRPNGASGSVCHSIQAYQSGQAIGWAHHAAATLPEDMK